MEKGKGNSGIAWLIIVAIFAGMVLALAQGFADLAAHPERKGTDCGYPGCVGWKGSNHGNNR